MKRIFGKSHYIITAMVNVSAALGAALEIWQARNLKSRDGVQELVHIINVAAIQLKNRCELIKDENND